MKDILFAVCVLSLFASAVTYLCPDGKGGTKKQVSLVCSFVLCVSMLSPLLNIVKDGVRLDINVPDMELDASDRAQNEIISSATQKICSQMEGLAESKYGVISPSLTLSIDDSDPQNIIILEGRLVGKGRVKEAAEYIESILMCKISFEEEDNG